MRNTGQSIGSTATWGRPCAINRPSASNAASGRIDALVHDLTEGRDLVFHLAAIRMERRNVFDATHQLILRLVGEGKVTGLRIDHPDGYYSYAAKYVDGSGVTTKIPAELSPEQTEAVQGFGDARNTGRSADVKPAWHSVSRVPPSTGSSRKVTSDTGSRTPG